VSGLAVAVTGATGFLGSHICEALSGAGCRVRAAHRATSSLRWLQDQPVETVLADLADPAALAALLAGCDAVVHNAGVVMAHAATYARVNVEGTRALLAAAACAGTVRTFLFISSLAAGGPGTLAAPRDETMPDAPISGYGRSKLAAEALVLAGDWPFRAVVLRPPSLYGPRDRSFRPLLRAAARGWTASFGRLRGLSLVHGQDAAAAVAALLVASAAEGIYYLDDGSGPQGPRDPNRRWPWGYHRDELRGVLGGLFGRPVRNLAVSPRLLRLAAGLVPGRARLRSPALHPDRLADLSVEGWVCAAAKLQQDTGWRPRWELAAGLRDTLYFYRRQGWLR
jgi:nucleoside-diphosphate-sugar epimerase